PTITTLSLTTLFRSPYAQGYGANQPEHCLQSQREGIDHGAVFNGVPGGGCLVVLGIKMVSPGEHFAHCCQCFLVQFRRRRLNDDHLRIFNILEVPKELERNESIFIIGTVVDRILDLVAHHAYNFEIEASDTAFLPNGRSYVDN